MSISSKIEELALDKAAIKAAIDAKLPSVPVTDSLSQWPTSIMSIPQTRREACWPGGPDIPEWKNDGDTWFWVDLSRCLPGYERKVAFQFVCNHVGGMTVDWGDGTTSTNTVGNGYVEEKMTHVYGASSPNSVQIKITTNENYTIGFAYTLNFNPFVESRPIYAVEFGSKTNIGQYHGGSGGVWDTAANFSNNNPTVVFIGDNCTFQGLSFSGVYRVYFGENAKFASTNSTSLKMSYVTRMETFDMSKFVITSAKNLNSMFSNSTSLNYVNVSNWDTSNATNMQQMFDACSSLLYVDVSSWDVSNVTTMYRLFWNCNSLGTLDFSKWNVSKVTDMRNMFQACNSMEEIDISNWTLASNVNVNAMFIYAKGPKSIKLPDIAALHDNMFNGCSNCLLYDFRKCTSVPQMSNTSVFTSINENAYIVVPDDLYSTWRESSNWSNSSIQPHIISVTDYEAL